MGNARFNDQCTRDTILKQLSDAEVAKVSNAETASGLNDGEEYIDLEHVDQGVQTAKSGTKLSMGHVVPRSAVSDDTWKKIITPFAR